MNNLIIGGSKIIIETSEEEVINILKKEFTYNDKSEVMSGGVYTPSKIKKVCFLKKIKQYHWLNRGFLFQLLKIIKKYNFNFNLEDQRKKINITIPSRETIKNILIGKSLYEYQIDAVLSVLKNKLGIIKAATSFGKTVTLAAILKYLDLPFIVIVNKKSLATQIYKELNDMGVECGVIHSEKKIIKTSMISTIQSVKKIPNLSDIKILALDEVHNASSFTYQDFLSKVSFPIAFGLSATPEKDPYLFALIRQYLGEIIFNIPTSVLIEENKIAEPFIYCVDNRCNPKIDWPSSEKFEIIENNDRNNRIINFVKNNPDKHFLIIIDKIEHGLLLNKMLPEAFFVQGSTKNKAREEVKSLMEKKEIKVIIASKVFLEGISISTIDCLINAAGGKAEHNAIQKGGRALRLAEGKDKGYIIEFMDNGNKILHNQFLSRIKAYRKEGYKNIIKLEDRGLKL